MMQQRIGTIVAGVLLLSLLFGGVALAHAKLVSSDPAAGAKLTAAPAKISLVFSEEISEKADQSYFTVTDASGTSVGSGKLDTNDLDHKTQTGTLKSGIGDGVYTVSWFAVTPDDDGHSQGSFTFGVNKDPGPQPTAAAEHDEAAATVVATTAATSAAKPTSAATAGAAKPTSAPSATDTAGNAPTTLPKTGENGQDGRVLALVGVALLIGGVAFARSRRGLRR